LTAAAAYAARFIAVTQQQEPSIDCANESPRRLIMLVVDRRHWRLARQVRDRCRSAHQPPGQSELVTIPGRTSIDSANTRRRTALQSVSRSDDGEHQDIRSG
jgi:hypothetical protein